MLERFGQRGFLRKTYLPGNQHIPYQGRFEDVFPLPQLGDVSFRKGSPSMGSVKKPKEVGQLGLNLHSLTLHVDRPETKNPRVEVWGWCAFSFGFRVSSGWCHMYCILIILYDLLFIIWEEMSVLWI